MCCLPWQPLICCCFSFGLLGSLKLHVPGCLITWWLVILGCLLSDTHVHMGSSHASIHQVYSYERRWDSWGRLIAPHTSRYAWANIEGNHEIEVGQLPG